MFSQWTKILDLSVYSGKLQEPATFMKSLDGSFFINTQESPPEGSALLSLRLGRGEEVRLGVRYTTGSLLRHPDCEAEKQNKMGMKVYSQGKKEQTDNAQNSGN